MITTIIINKLHKKEQLSSYCLIFRSVSSQIVLDNSIQDFTLIISLRIISNKELLLNYLNLADFSLKVRDNVRISICHNVFQKVKIILNMLKKELYKVCSYKVILSEYKQHILYNIAHYDQNTIIFLIILHWQKQFCNSIQINLLE